MVFGTGIKSGVCCGRIPIQKSLRPIPTKKAMAIQFHLMPFLLSISISIKRFLTQIHVGFDGPKHSPRPPQSFSLKVRVQTLRFGPLEAALGNASHRIELATFQPVELATRTLGCHYCRRTLLWRAKDVVDHIAQPPPHHACRKDSNQLPLRPPPNDIAFLIF